MINTDEMIGNISAMVARVAAIHPKMTDSTKRGIRGEAEEVMTDAKAHYVPVRKGQLRNSGTVENVITTGNEFSIAFHFSGPHAVAIHEVHSEHDPPSWKNVSVIKFRRGGPKYLEQPLRIALPGMNERIASSIELE